MRCFNIAGPCNRTGKGVEQTLRYMDVYGVTEGWLALFDRTPETAWEKKIYTDRRTRPDRPDRVGRPVDG
jgi:hypothetical protein